MTLTYCGLLWPGNGNELAAREGRNPVPEQKASLTPSQSANAGEALVAARFVQEFQWLLGAEEPLPQLFEKVERAKQEWEATADSLPELVCVLDEQGRVARASRAIETWGLAQVTQVHGRNFHQLMHPNCFGPFCDLYRFLEEARQTTPVDRAAELELADP